jgi:hypothetical protein
MLMIVVGVGVGDEDLSSRLAQEKKVSETDPHLDK